MNDIKKNQKVKRKLLPGLGGVTKTYIQKAALLEKTLLFLSRKIERIEFSLNEERKEKRLLKYIADDMIRLSRYKKTKKMDFYFECLEIIKHYES